MRIFLLIILFSSNILAHAESVSDHLHNLLGGESPAVEDEFLQPDDAFRFSATVEGNDSVNLFWQIADGYYLYRDKFSFVIKQGQANIQNDKINLPHGEVKQDESFGEVEVNKGEISVDLLLTKVSTSETPVTLEVKYQGCKEDAICYPPIKKEIALVLPE